MIFSVILENLTPGYHRLAIDMWEPYIKAVEVVARIPILAPYIFPHSHIPVQ